MPQAFKPDVNTSAAFPRRHEKRVADVGTPDRSILLFFILLAVTAFLATILLVEDNLFKAAWKTLLFLLNGEPDQMSFATIVSMAVQVRQPR